MCIKSVMSSSHLIFCHPLLLLPPNPPTIRVFSNGSTLSMRWPKYWKVFQPQPKYFSLSIIPSNEHPGLVSFRMEWLDLLAVQGTLKSLPHHFALLSYKFYVKIEFLSKSYDSASFPIHKPGQNSETVFN